MWESSELMEQVPVLKGCTRVGVVEGEGVVLLYEGRHAVLKGALCTRVLPLIDGRRTEDAIAAALAPTADPAAVYFLLMMLAQEGFVVWQTPPGASPSSSTSDAAASDAAASGGPALRLTAFGEVDAERFCAAWPAPAAADAAWPAAAVVLVDDYLHEALAAYNAAAVRAGTSYLLVRPVGGAVWVGPLVRPGHTGCWACLAQRLRANRPAEAFLRAHPEHAVTVLPAARAAAYDVAARHAARYLTGAATDHLTTIDGATGATAAHAVVRRPQCPVCGTGATAGRAARPLVLTSRPKRFTADGGHRTMPPEETYERLRHHVSPLTGAVRTLRRVPVPGDDTLYAFTARHARRMQAASLEDLCRDLRDVSGGKGRSEAQARTSGLCEAIERYAGIYQGDEPVVRGRYRELAEAVHPDTCLRFSAAQYAVRDAWNAACGCDFQQVPLPFDEDAEVAWTPVWSLTRGTRRLLPTAYCYFGFPGPEARSCPADSNGNAAGNTLEEAILQGLMELIERDGVSLWWHNRVRRPGVDLGGFDDPYGPALQARYARMGRYLWALDVTTDLGYPTIVALSRRVEGPREEILLGFGTHPEARIALSRALTELNQMLPWTAAPPTGGAVPPDPTLALARAWWAEATVAGHPYLLPDPAVPARTAADYEPLSRDDLREDVEAAVRRLAEVGLDVLVLDQSRPEIALNVVKVVVPGLRHYWRRLGPGRLYDVPVALGWCAAPRAEAEMNPVPLSL